MQEISIGRILRVADKEALDLDYRLGAFLQTKENGGIAEMSVFMTWVKLETMGQEGFRLAVVSLTCDGVR